MLSKQVEAGECAHVHDDQLEHWRDAIAPTKRRPLVFVEALAGPHVTEQCRFTHGKVGWGTLGTGPAGPRRPDQGRSDRVRLADTCGMDGATNVVEGGHTAIYPPAPITWGPRRAASAVGRCGGRLAMAGRTCMVRP